MKKNSPALVVHAELLLRVGLGLFLLLQGAMKFLTGYTGFVTNMSGMFAESMLPVGLVEGILYVVPFVEVVLGVWLLIGLYRGYALMLTGVLWLLFLVGHLFGGMPYDPLFLLLLVTGTALSMESCGTQEKK